MKYRHLTLDDIESIAMLAIDADDIDGGLEGFFQFVDDSITDVMSEYQQAESCPRPAELRRRLRAGSNNLPPQAQRLLIMGIPPDSLADWWRRNVTHACLYNFIRIAVDLYSVPHNTYHKSDLCKLVTVVMDRAGLIDGPGSEAPSHRIRAALS